MKTILKTLALSTLLISVGCNSNDDDSNTNNNGGTSSSLVGVWDLTNTDGELNITTNGVTVTGDVSGSNYDNSTITFTENPNKLDIAFDYTSTTSVTILGMTQSHDEDINESESGLDWTKTNNTLSVSGSAIGLDVDFEILELTNSTLTLQASVNESDTLGSEITSTEGHVNYYYTK